MAKVIRQIVVQDNLEGVVKRFIVQYYDDVTSNDLQQIIIYDSDLTADEKTTYDSFLTLCSNKINQ